MKNVTLSLRKILSQQTPILMLLGLFMTVSIPSASALLITDVNDGRSWQGATIQTFADLLYSGNKQQVIDNQLLDDGVFNPTGYVQATLRSTPWTVSGGGCLGVSSDLTGTGSFVGHSEVHETIFGCVCANHGNAVVPVSPTGEL